MASQSHVPTVSLSLIPSTPFVEKELRRIPKSARIGFKKLGLLEDLKQELHLAFYQSQAPDSVEPTKAMHAAGERFRYREVVRRARREVPEALAPRSYHTLVYGEPPEDDSGQ
jgi:hypothetical protein